MIRLLYVAIALLFIGAKLNAQSSIQLSAAEVELKHIDNQKKGLNPEAGMDSKFVIVYQAMQLSSEEVNKIISDMEVNAKVLEIKISQDLYQISIVTRKQKDSPQFALLKEILAKYNIRILSYEELSFLSKV